MFMHVIMIKLFACFDRVSLISQMIKVKPSNLYDYYR